MSAFEPDDFVRRILHNGDNIRFVDLFSEDFHFQETISNNCLFLRSQIPLATVPMASILLRGFPPKQYCQVSWVPQRALLMTGIPSVPIQ
jgi:hypothetical protein